MRIQSAEEGVAAELHKKNEIFSLARASLQNCNDLAKGKFDKKRALPEPGNLGLRRAGAKAPGWLPLCLN